MCIILIFVVMSSALVIHCEWIEISQPIRKLNQIVSNRSLVINDAEIPATIDYSKYKDFFSIIEPDTDFLKHITTFQKNTDNFTMGNKLKKKNFHTLLENPFSSNGLSRPTTTQDTRLLLDSKVSKLSAFSEIQSETHDKLVTSPVKVDSMRIKMKNEHLKGTTNLNQNDKKPKLSERRPSDKQDQIVFKRVEIKPFDFNGVLKFFANMQQSFPMDSFAGIRDKIKFLENFKNNLVENIEERFKMLWSTSGNQSKHRMRRSHGSNGMDFPSSETALMTISFLTLAVFLIKLVLQVIHTIKSKHVGYQSMTPVTANEAPIKIIKTNRNARKLSLSTSDDLRAVTESISSIEKNVNAYT